jgi:hypothetical protein
VYSGRLVARSTGQHDATPRSTHTCTRTWRERISPCRTSAISTASVGRSDCSSKNGSSTPTSTATTQKRTPQQGGPSGQACWSVSSNARSPTRRTWLLA